MRPVLSATKDEIRSLATLFLGGHLPCFRNEAECYGLAGRRFQDTAVLSKHPGHRIGSQEGDLFINTHDRSTTALLLTAGKGGTFHSRFESKVYPHSILRKKNPLGPVGAHD